MSRPILSAVLAIQVALGLLVGFVEGWSVGDAIYFTFVTGLTIGYGARSSSIISSGVKPCATMSVSVQPSGQEASNSSARRRLGLGPRLRREGDVGIATCSRERCLMPARIARIVKSLRQLACRVQEIVAGAA